MAITETGFRRPGRPRTLPADYSPSDRTAAWRQQLRANGGHILPVALGPLTWEALQSLACERERGPLIERLIMDELQRRNAVTHGQGAGASND